MAPPPPPGNQPCTCGAHPPSTPTRSSPKSSKTKGSSKNGTGNPYADRGRDKFTALLSEIEEQKKKIISQVGKEDVSLVRFVSTPENKLKPVVILSNGSSFRGKDYKKIEETIKKATDDDDEKTIANDEIFVNERKSETEITPVQDEEETKEVVQQVKKQGKLAPPPGAIIEENKEVVPTQGKLDPLPGAIIENNKAAVPNQGKLPPPPGAIIENNKAAVPVKNLGKLLPPGRSSVVDAKKDVVQVLGLGKMLPSGTVGKKGAVDQQNKQVKKSKLILPPGVFDGGKTSLLVKKLKAEVAKIQLQPYYHYLSALLIIVSVFLGSFGSKWSDMYILLAQARKHSGLIKD